MTASKKASPLFIAWMGFLGIVILAGLYVTYRLFTDGLGLLGLNNVMIWALPTVAYIYLTGASFGLCIVSTIAVLFGGSQIEPIAKRSVFLAIAAMTGGLVALVLHLGSPLNAIHMLLSPNLNSPFVWVAFFYAVYLISLLAEFLQIHRGKWNAKATKVFSLLALLAALGFHSSVGSVFGLTAGRPGYAGAVNPLYFPLAALVTGFALALLFNLLYHVVANGELTEQQEAMYNWLGGLLAGLLGVLLLLTFWKTLTGLYSDVAGSQVFEHMFGTLAFQLQLWIGLVVPFLMMVVPAVRKTTAGKVVAAVLVLLGMFIGRLELVLGGLMVPVGPQAVEFPSFVDPQHTIWAWLVVAVSLAVALLIYTLGERYLNLDAAPEAVAH